MTNPEAIGDFFPTQCDLCGKTLLIDEDIRYVLKIDVYAAYDPMELTADDLERDHRAEIKRLIEQMNGMDPQELEDSVHKEFNFQLCPACQREYIKNPLSRDRRE